MRNVRCADCGLLAIQHHKTLELIEVDESLRNRWAILIKPNEKILEGQWPVCSALAADLLCEIMDGEEELKKPKVVSVLNKKRECQKFTQWIPGFDPKEHKEMIQAESLLRMNRRFQVITTLIAAGFGLIGVVTGAVIVHWSKTKDAAPAPVNHFHIVVPNPLQKADPPK